VRFVRLLTSFSSALQMIETLASVAKSRHQRHDEKQSKTIESKKKAGTFKENDTTRDASADDTSASTTSPASATLSQHTQMADAMNDALVGAAGKVSRSSDAFHLLEALCSLLRVSSSHICANATQATRLEGVLITLTQVAFSGARDEQREHTLSLLVARVAQRATPACVLLLDASLAAAAASEARSALVGALLSAHEVAISVLNAGDGKRRSTLLHALIEQGVRATSTVARDRALRQFAALLRVLRSEEVSAVAVPALELQTKRAPEIALAFARALVTAGSGWTRSAGGAPVLETLLRMTISHVRSSNEVVVSDAVGVLVAIASSADAATLAVLVESALSPLRAGGERDATARIGLARALTAVGEQVARERAGTADALATTTSEAVAQLLSKETHERVRSELMSALAAWSRSAPTLSPALVALLEKQLLAGSVTGACSDRYALTQINARVRCIAQT
jgi:hypothetical protein